MNRLAIKENSSNILLDVEADTLLAQNAYCLLIKLNLDTN